MVSDFLSMAHGGGRTRWNGGLGALRFFSIVVGFFNLVI